MAEIDAKQTNEETKIKQRSSKSSKESEWTRRLWEYLEYLQYSAFSLPTNWRFFNLKSLYNSRRFQGRGRTRKFRIFKNKEQIPKPYTNREHEKYRKYRVSNPKTHLQNSLFLSFSFQFLSFMNDYFSFIPHPLLVLFNLYISDMESQFDVA